MEPLNQNALLSALGSSVGAIALAWQVARYANERWGPEHRKRDALLRTANRRIEEFEWQVADLRQMLAHNAGDWRKEEKLLKTQVDLLKKQVRALQAENRALRQWIATHLPDSPLAVVLPKVADMAED